MISCDVAIEKILTGAESLDTELCELENLSNRIISEPIFARHNLPMFDNSAVDGFGVRAQDVLNASEDHPLELKLLDTITAGESKKVNLEFKTAVKLLTGAQVPESVTAVIMKEDTEQIGNTVQIKKLATAHQNIRKMGEEFRVGDILFDKGTSVTPPVIGLLAAQGFQSISVYKKPRVSLIITGNELRQAGDSIESGEIYDSNSFSLTAALKELHIEDVCTYHVRDKLDQIELLLRQIIEKSDVVITTGGVSVGETDYVRQACLNVGVQEHIWRVAIKPGKPFYFGTVKHQGSEKLFFGLPGNPVAVLITYHQFVKPALLKMMGHAKYQPQYVSAIMTENISKKKGRKELVRGIFECEDYENYVRPTRGQESHMLGGIATANCLIHFPEQEEYLLKGQKVRVEMLNWRT